MTVGRSVPAVIVDPRAGRALVAFGASGVAITLALGLMAMVVLGPLVLGAANLERQRASAIAGLDAAGQALDALTAAADHATSSLAQSETSVRDAAAVTGQLADAMAGLAALSGAFGETADRARALSDDLGRTADALRQNQADSLAATEELRALGGRVRELRTALEPATPGGEAFAIVGPVLLVGLVVLLLGWLGVAAVACLVLGRRLLRSSSQLGA